MEQNRSVRQSIAISVVLLSVLFLLPLLVITPPSSELFSGELPMDETEEKPLGSSMLDEAVMLRVLQGETVQEMNLKSYLMGVVRAEMPATFEPNALCAQAVAARTYTVYKLQQGGSHGETADICTNAACCQAYLDEETSRKNWGEQAVAYEEKIAAAVQETDGQVILYEGQPILAVFHSSSAGLTRAAGAVWQTDLPYLQAVGSREPGGEIPNYYSRAVFSPEEFRTRWRRAHPEGNLSDEIGGWIRNAVVDEAGSVETVEVGGVTIKGSELRSILGLRSACFTWEIQEGQLVFFVTGYGHGVGLSQYGANEMARSGTYWQEILTHYYTGVTVEPYYFTNAEKT